MEWNETSPVMGPGQVGRAGKTKSPRQHEGKSPGAKRGRVHTIWEKRKERQKSGHLQLGIWQKRLFSNVLTQKVNVFEMLKTPHIFC